MKKILFSLMFLALAAAGCQQEEQRPIPQGAGGVSPLNADNEIRLLKSILQEDPGNLGVLIKLGNISMDSGRYTEAIDAYGRALEIDPKNTNVRVDMGVCYRRIGRSDRAVEEFKKAIETDPSHAYAHMNFGVVLAYDMGKAREAIKEFEKYIELAPGNQNVPTIRQEIERLKSLLSSG